MTETSETHPDPATLRGVAAVLVTLPSAAALTMTLWALAGACATSAQLWISFGLFFAGFLPFSLTVQTWQGTWLADRMRFGRLGLFSGAYLLFLVAGPGPAFLNVPCGTGTGIVESGATLLVVGWTVWLGLRLTEPAVQSD